MNRLVAATGVAVVNSHSDHQGYRWKSGIKSIINPSFKRWNSSDTVSESPDIIQTLSSTGDNHHLRRKQNSVVTTDESVRQAMFLNCWGPS